MPKGQKPYLPERKVPLFPARGFSRSLFKAIKPAAMSAPASKPSKKKTAQAAPSRRTAADVIASRTSDIDTTVTEAETGKRAARQQQQYRKH